MDSDVGPNAPGSNFSRLERHSADRRIGPASLNHHPNRLCGRQRPHQRSHPSRQRPHITKCIRGGEIIVWGAYPKHSFVPHVYISRTCRGCGAPAMPSTAVLSLRTTVWVKGQVTINSKPSTALGQALDRLSQHNGPPNQVHIGHSGSHPLDPRRHHRLWNAFAVGKN